MNTSLLFPIHETTQAGAARRTVAEWAQDSGWDETMRGRLALVTTELGRNLAAHATRGGELLVRPLSYPPLRGVEVTSVDRGPGEENFHRCLRDGYSTAGTPGTGLGAVQRVSDSFSFYSQPGSGTILVSEMWEKPSDAKAGGKWDLGAVCVPAPGERMCGDAWSELRPRPEVLRLFMADGLGHGIHAADAARVAVEIFHKHPTSEITTVMKHIHDALRSTRGAAGAIAEINLARGEVAFTGVGNIAACMVTRGKTSSLVSMNGTLGALAPNIRSFTAPWTEGAALVLSSDGIKTHWQLDRYPGLGDRSASLIAGALYRDYLRGKDDATVVVVREKK